MQTCNYAKLSTKIKNFFHNNGIKYNGIIKKHKIGRRSVITENSKHNVENKKLKFYKLTLNI